MNAIERKESTDTGFKIWYEGHEVFVHLVGIHGPPGAGKDTLCNIFDHWIHSVDNETCIGEVSCPLMYFRRVAFADALKKGCAEFFGIPVRDFYDGDKKEVVHPYWLLSPRQIAQQVGTEAMRENFNKDIWLMRIEWEVMRQLDPSYTGGIMNRISTKIEGKAKTTFHIFFFVSDVRFQNEADWVHKNNGFIFNIETNRSPATIHMNHASEAGIELKKERDVTIGNFGSLYEFKSNCVETFNKVFRKR